MTLSRRDLRGIPNENAMLAWKHGRRCNFFLLHTSCGCSISIYAADVPPFGGGWRMGRGHRIWAPQGASMLVRSLQTPICHTCLSCAWLLWHRPPHPKRHRLRPFLFVVCLVVCFGGEGRGNFQTSTFNKLKHKSTEKLLWVYFRLNSCWKAPRCSVLWSSCWYRRPWGFSVDKAKDTYQFNCSHCKEKTGAC